MEEFGHDLLLISNLILPAILLFITILTIQIFLNKTTSSNAPQLPPGPRKLPIIGNLHQLMGKSLPHHRLAELATQYGPLMYLKLGETRNVVVSSPEVAREAAIIFYNARDIAFGAYGDYWRQMRKICTLELLSGHRVRLLRPVREEEISRLVKSIQRQSQVDRSTDLSRLLISLGNTITSRAAFGKVRKLEEAFLPVLNKIVKVLGGGTERQVMKLHREADEILEGIIHEHIQRRRARSIEKDGKFVADEDDHEEDIVDVLLSFTENHDLGFPFTNVEIKVVILRTYSSGGSDSSSTTVEWAMSELMKNPSVMKKAQKEVRQVFDKRGHIVDEAGLDELHYLPLIIKETFRLHPTAPLLIPRECRETIVIDGYLIPAKTRVHINAWAIGRDPRHWTDPDEFIPERFIDSSVDYKGHDFQLIPFGAGRRVCPGMQYGLAVVELLLANLLYHFDWKLSDDEMKPRDLDMDEEFGAGVTRKNNLFLISVTYHGD
ncbi:Desmethyl-deoxy-podophyllotoxin synthase [Linum perenne]